MLVLSASPAMGFASSRSGKIVFPSHFNEKKKNKINYIS